MEFEVWSLIISPGKNPRKNRSNLWSHFCAKFFPFFRWSGMWKFTVSNGNTHLQRVHFPLCQIGGSFVRFFFFECSPQNLQTVDELHVLFKNTSKCKPQLFRPIRKRIWHMSHPHVGYIASIRGGPMLHAKQYDMHYFGASLAICDIYCCWAALSRFLIVLSAPVIQKFLVWLLLCNFPLAVPHHGWREKACNSGNAHLMSNHFGTVHICVLVVLFWN